MPTHTLAAIQMSSAYGEVQANLAKAEVLVHNAAAAGAELVVLPELFNTGYAYTPLNYELAETPDGLTAGWIKQLAKNLDIHLAGSFLQRRDPEIYNTLQLTAPDGRTWTYDKTHPWGWERAYFCPGRGPKIAETRLGRIGLLICYDVAHPNSFSAYAGKIQLLLISSSPPKVNRMRLHFPGEEPVEMEETGAVARLIQESGDEVFDADLRAQTAWLGVPLINAMPYGEFSSAVPKPKRSFAASLSGNVRLWRLVSRSSRAGISADYNQHTMITASDGTVLARPPEGDSIALAEVDIPDNPPQPSSPQPRMRLHPASRWVSSLLSRLILSEYKENKSC